MFFKKSSKPPGRLKSHFSGGTRINSAWSILNGVKIIINHGGIYSDKELSSQEGGRSGVAFFLHQSCSLDLRVDLKISSIICLV